MSIEHCQNFRREYTKGRNEVSYCAVKGTDYNCGGYSDFCPPKMQKYFIPDRDVKQETIIFKK